MGGRFRLVGALLLVGLLLLTAACSKPKLPKVNLAAEEKIQKAQTEVTFPLILPTYLPEGYQLGGVWVDRFPMANRVRVSYRFHWPAEPLRNLQIDLDPGPGKVEIAGEPEPEQIQVNGLEGLYQELVREDATVRGLVFYRPGLSINLVSVGLSRSELFRIAESMAD